jgi:hypothetical protein
MTIIIDILDNLDRQMIGLGSSDKKHGFKKKSKRKKSGELFTLFQISKLESGNFSLGS